MKKTAEDWLRTINNEMESELKSQWELETSMRRVGLRNKRGVKLKWSFTEKTGKLIRKSKGGVDFYRYCHVSSSLYRLLYDLGS